MSWYRSGTIAVTNGSTAVVGTSTAFIANVAIGEGLLAPDGKVYEITAVTSDTGLTLGSAYLGSNSSGQTYAIIPSQSYVRDLATQAATLVNSYQSVKDNAGSGKFGDGTVGSPGIQFTSDSDTGIRRTGANAIALVTGGADRVTVNANGTLAVTNSSSSNAMVITQTGTGNALVVEDSASTDSTPFVITNDGTVVAGTTAAVTGIKIATFNGNSGVGSYSADAFCYGTRFNKSRSATVGAYSILSSGDDIGDVLFYGDDGTQFVLAALIRVEVDGTPGTNDMPGRLVFSTTADGESSPTERMRIDSAGNVGIGGAATAGTLDVQTQLTGGTFKGGIISRGQIQSGVSSRADNFLSVAACAAGSYVKIVGYQSQQGTISGTVTNLLGFQADASLTGATNNYGFYSNIASAANRYNFYAAGTAANYFAGVVQTNGATAIPAGGTAGVGITVSSTANFGVFFGSGAPTLSAAKGSLYLRSDGSTTNDRMYVNTNGSTTWTAVTTAA